MTITDRRFAWAARWRLVLGAILLLLQVGAVIHARFVPSRYFVVAFTRQEPLVTSQCVVNSESWCYTSSWSPSSDYAPTKAAALTSISNLKAILDTLAP